MNRCLVLDQLIVRYSWLVDCVRALTHIVLLCEIEAMNDQRSLYWLERRTIRMDGHDEGVS